MITAQLTSFIPASVAKFADKQEPSNTVTVIAIPAVENKRIVIQGIQGSYTTTPVGGRLHITDGLDTFFEVDITAAGFFAFNPVLAFPVSKGVVITLAAGGGTAVGKLNAQWIEYAE